MATHATHTPLIMLLLVSLLLTHVWAISQQTPYAAVLSSSSLRKLSNGDTLVGVHTFLTLFVWKDRVFNNVSTSNSFFSDWLDKLNSSSSAIVLTRDDFIQLMMKKKGEITQVGTSIKIGIENHNVASFNEMLKFHNLTSDTLPITVRKMRVWSEPCRIGNVFEQHDAVVMDPYDFAFYLRTYRDRTQQSTTASQNYINTNDFIPIPLIPNTLIVKSVKNTWSDNTNLLQNQTMGLMFDYADMTCLNADVADAQTYRFLTGYSNFTQQDAELVRYISRKAISYDWRVYNHYMPLFLASHNLTSPNWNLNAVVSSLFPSTCHPCGADTLCLSKIFRPETDSGIFPQFIIFILYFVLLFATGSYKIPAFKRRLLVPYTPLLLFIVFLMFCNFLVRLCSPIFHFVSMIIYTWFFLIYFFSVVRFYYLRNLYTFISKSRHKKLLKILATNRVGLFITGFLSFMMSVVFSSIGIYIFFGNSIEETNTFRVIFLFVIIILGSILALIAISFDIFVNRKKIRQKGLFTFLLFDDPFYVRIDLISISLVIIVAILVILGNTIPGLAEAATSGGASAILNTVLCICCVMFCGGTTLTIEIVKKLRNRNAKKTSTELQDLLAENIDLLELLKEYASKEFSIENIELFSLLKSIKSETVSLSQLEDIEKDFIANFSKYEINLPSSTKHHFYKLLEECRNANLQQVSTQKLFDVIWNELIINILDTFGRLEQTAQYKEWLSIKTMQENRGLK